MSNSTSAPNPIRWHRLLGTLMSEVLTPVHVTVQTELPVMSQPPAVDILILRREGQAWTAAQRARLPDGVRDTDASYVLLEFKYTESFNIDALKQALIYDTLYKQAQDLPDAAVATFVLSARTPRAKVLAEFGYQQVTPGVYHSSHPLLHAIGLLVLNELPDKVHNAFVKSFASRARVRVWALQTLRAQEEVPLSTPATLLLSGLAQHWSQTQGVKMMEEELTPERVMEMGREWLEHILWSMSPEERMAGLRPEERMAGLRPEERLVGLRPEERLVGLRPEERMAGLRPEEWLAGLDMGELEEIEAYLRQRKQAEKSAGTSKKG